MAPLQSRSLLPTRGRRLCNRPHTIFFLLILIVLFRFASIQQQLPEDNRWSDQPFLSSKTSNEPRQKLPTPILVMGMPKTGTSTIYSFFNRSGYHSSHFKCGKYFCGLCFKVAIKKSKPPLRSCGNYEVFAQMDVENWGQCHFPQITNLEQLHEEAPNATFILNLRNLSRWATSVENWGGGGRSLAERLARCKSGPKSPRREDLIDWHQAHIERIRSFVKEHPSHALAEIDIEDPSTGEIMAQLFGSNKKFWGHENDSVSTNVSRTTSRPS